MSVDILYLMNNFDVFNCKDVNYATNEYYDDNKFIYGDDYLSDEECFNDDNTLSLDQNNVNSNPKISLNINPIKKGKLGYWYKSTFIPNFNNFKITTTVMIVVFNREINYEAAYHLLPITKMILSEKRKSKKCILPHCSIPGSIISLKSGDQVRGIVKSFKKGFKHSISIDVSIKTKNINVQMSAEKLKISGSTDEKGELGLEAVSYLITHLNIIQEFIIKMRENPEITTKTINWILENTRGSPVIREVVEVSGRLIINRKVDDFLVEYPLCQLPEELDVNIARFLMSLITDYYYYNDMYNKIETILSVPDVVYNFNEVPLNVDCWGFSMINYNYNLKYEINLESLDNLIDGQYGFYSHYQNSLANCVTIEMGYDADSYPFIKQRNNKVPRITFLCYKTGSITHSGPGGSLMKESYDLFHLMMADLKPYILA